VLAVDARTPIDMDGSSYVRIAQNILAGHAALGMRGEPVVTFAPLYSWLIALVAAFGINAETAALAIALVAGTAFVALVYVLAATIYHRTSALYAAAIAAVLPICVQVSTSALSEAPFGAAAVAGTIGFVRLLRTWSRRDALLCGAAFGIAYLFRPEGALFAASACIATMIVAMRRRVSFAPVAVMVLTAAALCMPALAQRYAATGQIAIEGKSAINARIALGLRAGGSYISVANGVDEAGRPVGPEIDPRYYRPEAPTLPLQTRAALARGAGLKHVRDVTWAFLGREYGSGLLLGLAILGLAAAPWSRSRLGSELALIAFLACGYAALASVWHFWPRYGCRSCPSRCCGRRTGSRTSAVGARSRGSPTSGSPRSHSFSRSRWSPTSRRHAPPTLRWNEAPARGSRHTRIRRRSST
jgi:4-amino-4-deoxy-L-arabinose transferase-like glycosyltransferase